MFSSMLRPQGALYGVPTTPYAPDDTKNAYGDDLNDIGAIMKRLQSLPGNPVGPDGAVSAAPAAAAPAQPIVENKMPKAPPSKSTNPWSKENRSRTLLDLGTAFLSSPNFFEALGNAGQTLGARMDGLKAQNTDKREFGGPDDQFEIVTHPDGTRDYTRIPEFEQAIKDKEAAALAQKTAKAPDPKGTIDLRSRALHSILQLPPEQRAQAYADILNNPDRYGGLDITGMPPGFDPVYASVMSQMGETVPQAENSDYRERSFTTRTRQGDERLAQGRARLAKTGSGRGGSRAAPKPPAGFILD